MEGQRERARAAAPSIRRRRPGSRSPSDAARAALEQTPDRFVGYDTDAVDDATIVALFDAARAQSTRSPPAPTASWSPIGRRSISKLAARYRTPARCRPAAGEAAVDGIVRRRPPADRGRIGSP
jgi:hypothetical protein